jgi:hypothetical protein
MINIAYGCGMKFAAVDAAFSKHTVYRDGQLHLLTTRDGNNKVIVLAWAICETESGATYEYFASKCHEAGVSRYLSSKAIIFSDRQKGIKRFHAKFPAKIGRCFKHIIENAQKRVHGTGQSFTQSAAWALQRAPTEAEYKRALAKLTRECPRAARYFDDITPHVEVYQYAMNAEGIASHSFKTSQIVECMNGVFVEAREHAPYRLNAKILKWMGEQINERLESITKWIAEGHALTKYAYNLFEVQVSTTWPNWPNLAQLAQLAQLAHSGPTVTLIYTYLLVGPCTQVEVAKRAGQEVVSSGEGVYYVEDVRKADAKTHEVLLHKQKCCNYVVMHNQPCRHMVCVFHKEGMLGGSSRKTDQTIRTYWPKYVHSDNYQKMYQNVRLRQPEVYTGKYLGPHHLIVLRPRQRPLPRGRKRKARYTWKKTTKATVAANMGAITHAHYESVLEFF